MILGTSRVVRVFAYPAAGGSAQGLRRPVRPRADRAQARSAERRAVPVRERVAQALQGAALGRHRALHLSEAARERLASRSCGATTARSCGSPRASSRCSSRAARSSASARSRRSRSSGKRLFRIARCDLKRSVAITKPISSASRTSRSFAGSRIAQQAQIQQLLRSVAKRKCDTLSFYTGNKDELQLTLRCSRSSGQAKADRAR